MMHFNLTEGVLVSSLQASAFELAGIALALLLGGMAKGITGIGVPLIAMPILSQFLPIRHAVLLLSMPIILGNIPQALEGGQLLATARKIAAPIAGTVIGNIVGVAILLSLNPGHAQAASGALLIVAAALMLAAPKLNLPEAWQKPVGFALGFGAALMESIASVPGPLLATYLISSGATGRVFTKQIAIILVVSIVTLITTFSGAARERRRPRDLGGGQPAGDCRHVARSPAAGQDVAEDLQDGRAAVRARRGIADDLEIGRVPARWIARDPDEQRAHGQELTDGAKPSIAHAF